MDPISADFRERIVSHAREGRTVNRFLLFLHFSYFDLIWFTSQFQWLVFNAIDVDDILSDVHFDVEFFLEATAKMIDPILHSHISYRNTFDRFTTFAND